MRYRRFEEFWSFYLTQHAHPLNRAMHYLGTAFFLALLFVVVAKGRWLWIPFLPVVGYLPPWIGHFLIEKNRPATLSYPVYSLIADFRMVFLALLRRLRPELRKTGMIPTV